MLPQIFDSAGRAASEKKTYSKPADLMGNSWSLGERSPPTVNYPLLGIEDTIVSYIGELLIPFLSVSVLDSFCVIECYFPSGIHTRALYLVGVLLNHKLNTQHPLPSTVPASSTTASVRLIQTSNIISSNSFFLSSPNARFLPRKFPPPHPVNLTA